MKTIISTPKAPAAIGPYSQAVTVNGMLFTSGMIPIDPVTNTLVQGDVEVQGKVKVRDDVIAKTISLVNHKHTDSRNGNTSAPLP